MNTEKAKAKMNNEIGSAWLQERIGKLLFFSYSGGSGGNDGLGGTLLGFDDTHLSIEAKKEGQNVPQLLRRDRITRISD